MALNMNNEGYKQAIIVLEHCAKPTGFYASGMPGGYEAMWSRDSMITSLGACLVDNQFKEPFQKSLELLAKNQSQHGQIPNAVGSYNIERHSDVTFNSIDSSLWYIIGHHIYAKAYKDTSLLAKYKKSIDDALTWLQYQDPNEDTLLVQQPTMDWQDAFPHKYGRVINTQALYYSVLKLVGQHELAKHLKTIVNGETEQYLSLYSDKLGYYLPWAWKTHEDYREEEYWFDTLGNLLAIVSGLATPEITANILAYIDNKKISRPFPCQAIYPSIKPQDKEWHLYFEKSESANPNHYLNGGIWPFIGGFYVAALVKARLFSKAEEELEKLSTANKIGKEMEWGFHEWLEGKSGTVVGGSSPYQGWSAGTYLFASQCLVKKEVPFF
jgi:glycogen debranching enzyme